jgi:tubulin-specific chaperone A
MAPPSQLQIALSALQRLVKEEASYYKEMNQQKSRIAKLEATNGDSADGDGNEEYQLKQEVCSHQTLGAAQSHYAGKCH